MTSIFSQSLIVSQNLVKFYPIVWFLLYLFTLFSHPSVMVDRMVYKHIFMIRHSKPLTDVH